MIKPEIKMYSTWKPVYHISFTETEAQLLERLEDIDSQMHVIDEYAKQIEMNGQALSHYKTVVHVLEQVDKYKSKVKRILVAVNPKKYHTQNVEQGGWSSKND